MKKSLIFLVLFSPVLWGQGALHNRGNLKIHESGAIGFHSDLINNGSFDENLGLAGFFNANHTTISGAFRPIFRDVEVMVDDGLLLEIGLGIQHHLNFVDGNISSPRTLPDITTYFDQDAFFSGETDAAKVNGYAEMTDRHRFLFPIGDAELLRPLLLEMEREAGSAKCAYFFGNPNNPIELEDGFDTQNLGADIHAVSPIEFWHLDGKGRGRVELTWNTRSAIGNMVTQIEHLSVVGWHTIDGEWHDLGVGARNGTLETGRMVSDYFQMADYPILTFGSTHNPSSPQLSNYLITVNNDGVNDYLVIPAVERSPNNLLKIFNRWGRAVYIDEDYQNDFRGISNTGVAPGKRSTLPVGLYFYTIELRDLDSTHQGYVYINE